METESCNEMSDREKAMPYGLVRSKSADEWIRDHHGGTLLKAKALGYAWRDMYLEARTAHEWGWEFRIVPRSRVTFNDAYVESDVHELVEACWHQERFLALNRFPDSDLLQAKYMIIEREGQPKLEGVGMILRRTSAKWIPSGQIVYCIIAEFDPDSRAWKEARNPA